MSAAQTPGPKKVAFTETHAVALLGHWLGSSAACQGIQILEGGICSAVYRVAFDSPPYMAVVKLRSNSQDNPLPSERARIAFMKQHTNVP